MARGDVEVYFHPGSMTWRVRIVGEPTYLRSHPIRGAAVEIGRSEARRRHVALIPLNEDGTLDECALRIPWHLTAHSS